MADAGYVVITGEHSNVFASGSARDEGEHEEGVEPTKIGAVLGRGRGVPWADPKVWLTWAGMGRGRSCLGSEGGWLSRIGVDTWWVRCPEVSGPAGRVE